MEVVVHSYQIEPSWIMISESLRHSFIHSVKVKINNNNNGDEVKKMSDWNTSEAVFLIEKPEHELNHYRKLTNSYWDCRISMANGRFNVMAMRATQFIHVWKAIVLIGIFQTTELWCIQTKCDERDSTKSVQQSEFENLFYGRNEWNSLTTKPFCTFSLRRGVIHMLKCIDRMPAM